MSPVARPVLLLVLSLAFLVGGDRPASASASTSAPGAQTIRAMSWNIWRGGREDGPDAGPQAVIDVIRESGADLVAMQETYGSGERIAGALGFSFLPRGTNVSIHSRFPIVEDISVHEPFMCVGGLVALPGGERIAFYSIWLPYDAEIWAAGTRDSDDVPSMLAACRSSAVELTAIRDAIDARLAGPEYAGVPIIIAGDFNSMSHLDYREVARDQYGAVVDWPTSRVLTDAGYRDVHREVHPFIDRAGDRTWTPRFPEQEQDRIDFVYTRGERIRPLASRVIDTHPAGFPSDHAAVLAELRVGEPEPITDSSLRVVSYNIKHGRGMDGVVDLPRIAGVLESLAPDIVGLQEVDLGVRRSGSVNQAAELGRRLGMHASFGMFMPYDGGRYGMAILSRHPIQRVRAVELPAGGEPRVALAVEVRGPDGRTLLIVNVHLDWIDDDAARFAQATALAGFLREQTLPYVLLGDFNDQPGSRTIELFRALAAEATKPAGDRQSFPADAPDREIDFVFTAPDGPWVATAVRVVDEPLASDHRPVFVRLESRRPGED